MTTATVVRIGDQTRPSRLVAAEVRAEMGRAGINQTELARRMGVTQAWLSRRIGARAPVDITFEEALAMGEAVGIGPDRLLSLLLPRLDSNQQPSGYLSSLVRRLLSCFTRRVQAPTYDQVSGVIELAAWRDRRAS